MDRIRVHRSPLRQFFMGAAGLLLFVVAFDIVWVHELSKEPDTNDAGELTRRGEARLRQDVLVGTTFFLTGGALVAVALVGLVSAQPVCEVDDEGISLRIGGPRITISLGWGDVLEVRSGRDPGDDELTRPALLVLLRYPDLWPSEYWGARRVGPWLIVDAASWNVPPEEVVVHAGLALTAFGRSPPAAGDDDEADAEAVT